MLASGLGAWGLGQNPSKELSLLLLLLLLLLFVDLVSEHRVWG